MEKDEKKTLSGALNAWLAKNRVVILSVVAVLLVAGVVFAVVYSVNEKTLVNGYEKLDAISYELTSLNSDELSEEALAEKKASLTADLVAFAEKNKTNAVGSRAYMLAAEEKFAENAFAEAKDFWLLAAKANKKAYTAPLCWYNAAICCEELADADGAIANLSLAIESENFNMKPRALFNAGRIEEERGNFAKAAEFYNKANDEYAGDSWANLAKSRLIVLEAEGNL